jgi:uroporphyrinogen decarboxylase
MSIKQTIQNTFHFIEPDTVPYHIWMHPDTRARLDDYYGHTRWADSFVQYVYNTKFFGFPSEPAGEDLSKDAFGTVWQAGAPNTARHMVQPALDQPSLEGFAWPSPERDIDWPAIERELADHSSSYRMTGLGGGLFERAWMLRGMTDLLLDIAFHPSFVHELLDRILEIHIEALQVAAARLTLDAYFTGDDWAGQTNLLISPDMWRTFIKPRLRQLVDRCHACGLPFILHSCGNYIAVLDDLIEIGVDGLESLQPEAIDVFRVKQRTMGRVFLIGGMGVQSTLFHGTPDRVRAVTKRLLVELGRGGGYVISPAKPLHEQTLPIGNIAAFLETIMFQ